MKLPSLATIAVGAVAGYLGARTLLERDSLPEQLPAPVRARLESAAERLRHARSEAVELLVEVGQARAAAERELTQDYLRRVGRGDDSSPSGLPPEAR